MMTTTIRAADGTNLVVESWGDGPPVVLLHAWGLSARMWDYQVPALVAAGYRCIVPDRRGHGRSDVASGGYDLDTLADDLALVLDELDVRGAVEWPGSR